MEPLQLLLTNMLIGLLISIVVSVVAYYKKSLTQSGMITAVIMGTIIFVTGGFLATGVLLAFFVSSSIISHFGTNKSHSARGYKQVLANGLIGTIMLILFALLHSIEFYVLFGVSIAVSTADTWAGEIGILSKSNPRHLFTLKPIEKGLSGGVTVLGIMASLLGSLLISAFFVFHYLVVLGGLLGSLIDSALGTIQVKYITSTGETLDQDKEGVEIIETKGIRWLSNNLVNLCSNVIAVFIAFVILSM